MNTSLKLRIAFGHKARSGKDTAAEYLMHNVGGTNCKFTDRLYSALHTLQRELDLPEEKDTEALQWIGTSYGRKKDPDFWLKRIVIPEDDHVYCTDMRFPNEAEYLKSKGFFLVKVNRPNRPIDRDPTHISETALDNYSKWDYVIENDGTLDDFYVKVDQVVSDIIDRGDLCDLCE